MSASSTRRLLLARRFAETLVYAGAGSATLGLAGLPAGWLSGAIVGVSAAALSGRPMYVPPPIARDVYVILGISLGSSVTPETVATMASWPLSMLALTIAMVAITCSVMAYLKFVHGWPTLDALFAAAPGALAQAMALAQDTGANVRAIAMVQTVRLFVLAVALPLIFAAAGVAGLPPPRGGSLPLMQLLTELGRLILLSSAPARRHHPDFVRRGGHRVPSQHAGGPDRRRDGGVGCAARHRGGACVPSCTGCDLLLHRDGRNDRHPPRRRGFPAACAPKPRRDGRAAGRHYGRLPVRAARVVGPDPASRRRGDGLCAGGDRGDDHHRVRAAPRSGVRRRAPPRALHLHVAGAAGRGGGDPRVRSAPQERQRVIT